MDLKIKQQRLLLCLLKINTWITFILGILGSTVMYVSPSWTHFFNFITRAVLEGNLIYAAIVFMAHIILMMQSLKLTEIRSMFGIALSQDKMNRRIIITVTKLCLATWILRVIRTEIWKTFSSFIASFTAQHSYQPFFPIPEEECEKCILVEIKQVDADGNIQNETEPAQERSELRSETSELEEIKKSWLEDCIRCDIQDLLQRITTRIIRYTVRSAIYSFIICVLYSICFYCYQPGSIFLIPMEMSFFIVTVFLMYRSIAMDQIISIFSESGAYLLPKTVPVKHKNFGDERSSDHPRPTNLAEETELWKLKCIYNECRSIPQVAEEVQNICPNERYQELKTKIQRLIKDDILARENQTDQSDVQRNEREMQMQMLIDELVRCPPYADPASTEEQNG